MKGYYNIVFPISSIQINQDIDITMLYSNSIPNKVSLKMLWKIINTSNFEHEDVLIELIKSIKKQLMKFHGWLFN